MIHHLPPFRLMCAMLIALSSTAALAHPSAHVHGRIQLGVAQDGDQLVIDVDTPLDSLLGFEHAPKTPAQKKLAADWADRLRTGAGLLRINPQARCTLTAADLDAPVLGLTPTSGHGKPKASSEHADLEGQWSFRCEQPSALRTIDLGFFDASPHARHIEVQWLKDGRQGQQTLKRPQSRVTLTPGK